MRYFHSALLLVFGLSLFKPAIGQIDPTELIKGAQSDINYLAEGYLEPFGNSLATGLNNNWYQTAKTHKTGRFDLMFYTSLVFVPSADQTFTINNSELQQLELTSGISASAPTVFGEDSPGPGLRFKDDPNQNEAFRTPAGIGFGAMPLLMAQANIGVFKNTDLTIRYIPESGVPLLDGGQIGLFGVGVKHDVLQWIPGDKVMPIDLSVFLGYTSLTFTQALDDGSGNPGQELVLNSRGFTGRAIVSKKFLFFTPYLGVGFNGGGTDIQINGTYEYEQNSPAGPIISSITDPVNITANDAGGFVANVGFQLKFLWVMAFTVDYTLATYSALNAGLGLSLDF